jgi:hypothetical protein
VKKAGNGSFPAFFGVFTVSKWGEINLFWGVSSLKWGEKSFKWVVLNCKYEVDNLLEL